MKNQKTKFKLSTLIFVETLIILTAITLNIYKLKIEPALATDFETCSLESVHCKGEVKPYYPPQKTVKPPEFNDKQASVQEIIAVVAQQEDISNSMLQYVAWCESRYILDRHNYDDPYGGAHGLYQVIFHWHPTVTVECSEDPWCATRYFVKRVKMGDGNLWACYQYYYNQFI